MRTAHNPLLLLVPQHAHCAVEWKLFESVRIFGAPYQAGPRVLLILMSSFDLVFQKRI